MPSQLTVKCLACNSDVLIEDVTQVKKGMICGACGSTLDSRLYPEIGATITKIEEQFRAERAKQKEAERLQREQEKAARAASLRQAEAERLAKLDDARRQEEAATQARIQQVEAEDRQRLQNGGGGCMRCGSLALSTRRMRTATGKNLTVVGLVICLASVLSLLVLVGFCFAPLTFTIGAVMAVVGWCLSEDRTVCSKCGHSWR